MDAITPDALVAAMAELDQEVAVLTERRRLLQQLLATFDDEHGETIEPQRAYRLSDWVPAPVPVAVDGQFALVDAKPARPEPQRKNRKWNYDEVAAVINEAQRTGTGVGRALMEHFDVTLANAQKLVKQARKYGLVADTRESFVPTPIERVSFDAQAARDAVAGPAVGPVRSFGLGTSKPAPKPAEPEPRFTMADAVAALEAS